MTDTQRLELDWPDIIKRLIDLMVPRSDDILASPAKLGELLTVCAESAEIEPVIRERATTLALQRREVPGWTLVHRDGQRYVEAHHLIELSSHCPLINLQSLMTTFAMQLGHVSETKYKLLCEAAGLPPQADAVKQTGATVFLRRHPSGENQQTER